MARLTLITNRPFSGEQSQGVATFVFPPGAFAAKVGDVEIENAHPIRIFQLTSSTCACARDNYLIEASMQLPPNAGF